LDGLVHAVESSTERWAWGTVAVTQELWSTRGCSTAASAALVTAGTMNAPGKARNAAAASHVSLVPCRVLAALAVFMVSPIVRSGFGRFSVGGGDHAGGDGAERAGDVGVEAEEDLVAVGGGQFDEIAPEGLGVGGGGHGGGFAGSHGDGAGVFGAGATCAGGEEESRDREYGDGAGGVMRDGAEVHGVPPGWVWEDGFLDYRVRDRSRGVIAA
jgi:hypothetical protein